MDLPALPTLGARKQKALMQDLDRNLSETFENIDRDSPTKYNENTFFTDNTEFIKKKQDKPTKSNDHEFPLEANFDLGNDLCRSFKSLQLTDSVVSSHRTQIASKQYSVENSGELVTS